MTVSVCVLCEGVRAIRIASGVLRILMESLECTTGCTLMRGWVLQDKEILGD